MGGVKGAARRGVDAAALPRSPLDALIAGVILLTATGFRFLGRRQLPDSGSPGTVDLLIAFEIVLIPLALAAMVVAAGRPTWRQLLQRPRWHAAMAGKVLAASALAAALLTTLQRLAPPPVPDTTPVVAALGLIAADELLRRAFLLNALAAAWGDGRGARAAALTVLAGAAAVGHAPGGLHPALIAAASDLILGLAYLLSGCTLWAPLLARGVADVGLRTVLTR